MDSRALRPRFALGARNNCDDGELRRPIVLDVAKASTRDAWPAVATGHRSRDTGIRPPAVDIASRYSMASATHGLFTGQPPQSRPIYRMKSVRRRGWQTSQCGSGEKGATVWFARQTTADVGEWFGVPWDYGAGVNRKFRVSEPKPVLDVTGRESVRITLPPTIMPIGVPGPLCTSPSP